MKLPVYHDAAADKCASRNQVGEVFSKEGVLRLTIFLLDIEIIAIESASTKGMFFTLWAIHPDGDEDYKKKIVGTMKVTQNGGIYIKLHFIKNGSFQVFDSQRLILSKEYEQDSS